MLFIVFKNVHTHHQIPGYATVHKYLLMELFCILQLIDYYYFRTLEIRLNCADQQT